MGRVRLHRPRVGYLGYLVLSAALLFACARSPKTADDVLDRAIAAHGGAALSDWTTLAIRGRIRLQDGVAYNAEYLLLAGAPDKLRVEHDLTKDRGRRFDEYFMNGAASWSRSNLVVGSANRKQLQRWFLQTLGPAQARRAGVTGLALKADATVDWQEPTADGWRTTDRRAAHVVAYTRDAETYELFVDKETFLVIQETWPGGRRLYRDFKAFGAVTWPTRILEITKGRQGEVVTPITFEAVTYNKPIEAWLFTEDKPRS